MSETTKTAYTYTCIYNLKNASISYNWPYLFVDYFSSIELIAIDLNALPMQSHNVVSYLCMIILITIIKTFINDSAFIRPSTQYGLTTITTWFNNTYKRLIEYDMLPMPLLGMRWTSQSINNQYSVVGNKCHV